jgi:PST family polysaccharide transporter
MQAAYLVMGRFMNEAAIGYYYFAYRLAAQSLSLFTVNISRVLFPALTNLKQNQAQQRQAFLRSLDVLGHVCVPLCLLQAAVVEPAIRLLWGDKWVDSIFVGQVISIAASFSIFNVVADSYFQALGRFRMRFHLTWITSTTTVLVVFIAATQGTFETVAVAAGIARSAIACLNIAIAARLTGGNVRIASMLARTFLLSAGPVGLVWAGAEAIEFGDSRLHQLAKLLLIGSAGGVLYVAALRLLRPAVFNEIKTRSQRLNPRRRKKPAPMYDPVSTPSDL